MQALPFPPSAWFLHPHVGTNGLQMPLQHSAFVVHGKPDFVHLCACALLASPKQASAMPARPTPNRFNAWRRVSRRAPCRPAQGQTPKAFGAAAVLLIGPVPWPVHRICCSCFSFVGLFIVCSGLTTDFTDDTDEPHCPTRREKMAVTPFWSTAAKADTNPRPPTPANPT